MTETRDQKLPIWGRYRPIRELGSGGMATVYLAEQKSDLGFLRSVAIKRIHPHLAKSLAYTKMFLDEANVLTSLRHPHIVPLLDVFSKDGELLLVMDFVSGLTVEELISFSRENEELLAPSCVTRIACDFLEGLHAAHVATNEAGKPLKIVHRDVSPTNVIVGTDGRSRILDFGIAQADGKLHLTEAGTVRGKARYMAPEQLLGNDVDARADVYSAGVTLWEMLVGRPAFPGSIEAAIATKVLQNGVPPLHEVSPSVPLALSHCVMKACARSPDQRYESALEFAEALEQTLAPAPHRKVAEIVRAYAENDGRESSAKLDPPSPSVRQPIAQAGETSVTSPVAARKSRRSPFFVAVGLAVVSGAFAAFQLFANARRVDPPRSEAPSPATPALLTSATLSVPKSVAPTLAEPSMGVPSNPKGESDSGIDPQKAGSSSPPANPKSPMESRRSGSFSNEKSQMRTSPNSVASQRKTSTQKTANKPIDDLFGQK